jgi:hypothetical protein
MKLRNKKTGEIIGSIEIYVVGTNEDLVILPFNCIDELNDEWEDYKPAEPLIKDEKIRKAVRAWADADGADEKIYLTIDENGSRFANKYGGYIEFAFQIDMDERLYTIVELCGEEKE